MFGFTKTTFVTVLASLALVNAAPVADAEHTNHLEARLTRTGRSTWFNVGLGNWKLFTPAYLLSSRY